MALFLLFPSEAEAVTAEARATNNVREAVRVVAPHRIADDGSILGVDAASWQVQPAAQRTERWAIPSEAEGGGWVMPLPLPEQIAPVPLEVFLVGVGGQEIDIPPQPEEPAP